MKLLTLKLNRDFKRLYNRGNYLSSPNLVTYVLKNRIGKKRLGITTSKKIGNAVKRNRARRVIKEAYRSVYNNLLEGFDIVFVARSRTTEVKTQEVIRDLVFQAKKLGIWRQNEENFNQNDKILQKSP